MSKDAWFGPGYLRSLAEIYAWTGEKDLAFTQLEELASQKVGALDYGDLKLDPDWDPLRGDARFQKLVQSLAPKRICSHWYHPDCECDASVRRDEILLVLGLRKHVPSKPMSRKLLVTTAVSVITRCRYSFARALRNRL